MQEDEKYIKQPPTLYIEAQTADKLIEQLNECQQQIFIRLILQGSEYLIYMLDPTASLPKKITLCESKIFTAPNGQSDHSDIFTKIVKIGDFEVEVTVHYLLQESDLTITRLQFKSALLVQLEQIQPDLVVEGSTLSLSITVNGTDYPIINETFFSQLKLGDNYFTDYIEIEGQKFVFAYTIRVSESNGQQKAELIVDYWETEAS